MKKLLLTAVITLIFSVPAYAQSASYTFAGGYPLLDMTSGTYDTLALYDLTAPALKQISPALDYMWCGSIVVFNHEYFGHGYRARDFGLSGYPVVTPVIGFYVVTDTIPNRDAELLIVGGGIESNLQGFRLFRERYLMFGNQNHLFGAEIHRINAYMYYLLFSAYFGDPYMHADLINQKYETNGRRAQITRDYIGVLFMTIDPLTLPLIPVIGRGFRRGQYFDIGSGGKFTWGTNYYMTPYGSEYDLDLCFVFGRMFNQFTLRYGDGGRYIFGGIDVSGDSVTTDYPDGKGYINGGFGWRTRRLIAVTQNIFLGSDLNAWYQPEENDGEPEKQKAIGYAGAGQIEFMVGPKMSFEIESGYKTPGFLPARSFKEEVFIFLAFNGNL